MINKYKQQICLGAFTIIIVTIFIIMMIRTNNSRISDFNQTPTTTTAAVESTVPETEMETIGTKTEAKLPKKQQKKNASKTGEFDNIKNIESLIDFSAKHPYMIRVNRAENFVTVYGMDYEGKHTIPYKTFWCSTGLDPESTPLGQFKISERYDWRIMVDGSYAQYAVRIYGPIMLHSIPYTNGKHDALEYWEYNKLGKPASLGCVRLRVKDIKWIYDNCNDGTKVTIYSEPDEEPEIALPKIKKIKKSNKNKNWDPTDPAKGNPWKNKKKTNTRKKTTTKEQESKKNRMELLWQRNIMP